MSKTILIPACCSKLRCPSCCVTQRSITYKNEYQSEPKTFQFYKLNESFEFNQPRSSENNQNSASLNKIESSKRNTTGIGKICGDSLALILAALPTASRFCALRVSSFWYKTGTSIPDCWKTVRLLNPKLRDSDLVRVIGWARDRLEYLQVGCEEYPSWPPGEYAGCATITSNPLQLLRKCPRLKVLKLNCPGISDKDKVLKEIKKRTNSSGIGILSVRKMPIGVFIRR